MTIFLTQRKHIQFGGTEWEAFGNSIYQRRISVSKAQVLQATEGIPNERLFFRRHSLNVTYRNYQFLKKLPKEAIVCLKIFFIQPPKKNKFGYYRVWAEIIGAYDPDGKEIVR